MSNSSVWSNEDGFGGDGDPNGEITVSNGRCVIDGPFANTQVHYHDMARKDHCLSRGFINADTMEEGSMSGYWLRPDAMGRVSRAADYDTFRNALEFTAHNGLHWSIRGDFAEYSAANGELILKMSLALKF